MKLDNLKINLQYFLPKHLLTRVAGAFASARLGSLTTYGIKKFAAAYHLNLQEMEGDISDYHTFNDFFARPLKAGARPIDGSVDGVVFPSDGKISQFGDLKDNFQLQAKGHYFTTEALLGDDGDAKYFKNGKFITVYLSPKDYHRVHLPYGGKLLKMTYIPGELFSVNPLYVRHIPELYSRNERVVCLFETAIGKMAVVFVGAAIVRSISTDWAGVVAPSNSGDISVEDYTYNNFQYEKGEEIGRFFMGSTVICMFEKNKIKFENIEPEQEVKVGQKMAQGNSMIELKAPAPKTKSTTSRSTKSKTATKKSASQTTARKTTKK